MPRSSSVRSGLGSGIKVVQDHCLMVDHRRYGR
jgi:predicted CoA-binding protein